MAKRTAATTCTPWEFSLTKYTTDDTDGGADGSTDDAAETGTICAKVFAAVTVEEWDDQIRVSMPQPFPPSRVVHTYIGGRSLI